MATPELLPTELRTFGHAICVSFSKFGAFVAPYVVVSNLGITSIAIILCTVNIAAAALSMTLRETVGKCLIMDILLVTITHILSKECILITTAVT